MEQLLYQPPDNGSSWKILIAHIHRAQQTDKTKSKGTDLINVPPGCTSRVQPLDVAFNKPFKDIIHKLFGFYSNIDLVSLLNTLFRNSGVSLKLKSWMILSQAS